MTDDVELSRRLTGVVSDLPGVTGVYPVGTLVRSIARGLVDAALDEGAADARVAVTRDPGGVLSLAATIGVEAGRPVPEVLRAVGDAIRDAVASAEPDTPPPVIDVRASHIDTRAAGA